MKKWLFTLVVLGVVMWVYFSADRTDYSRLTGRPRDYQNYDQLSLTDREKVCRSAAAANPSLVKQLNAAALSCVSQIQKELAALGSTHPSLSVLENSKLDLPIPNKRGGVACSLERFKNTHTVHAPSCTLPAPDKNGIILLINISDICAVNWLSRHYGAEFNESFLVCGIEIEVSYHLELGEEN